MYRWVIFFGLVFLCNTKIIYAQGCCSGGSGSPIAGGTSPGVLGYQQMELATNFQLINSDRFKAKNKDTVALFDNYNSKYIYSKVAYGLTKELTFSVEMGYFLNKTQIGLDSSHSKINASGIGDLIIFPRYNVYSKVDSVKRWDITVGMGYKIPIGKHDVSALASTNIFTGEKFYTTPPLVQPTTGSHDFIFYGFILRGFPQRNFKIFANATYIAKGWNSLGEKFGNYSNMGIFASKTVFKKIGLTLQVKGEKIEKMRKDKNVDLLALYNVDTASTGMKRVMLVPQISYSFKNLTVYGLYEIPLYEYVYGSQVVTQTQITVGLSYRFFTTKNPVCPTGTDATYYECPMKCEGSRSTSPGKCRVCGMDLIKVK